MANVFLVSSGAVESASHCNRGSPLRGTLSAKALVFSLPENFPGWALRAIMFGSISEASLKLLLQWETQGEGGFFWVGADGDLAHVLFGDCFDHG